VKTRKTDDWNWHFRRKSGCDRITHETFLVSIREKRQQILVSITIQPSKLPTVCREETVHFVHSSK